MCLGPYAIQDKGRDGVAALNLFVMRHDRHIRDGPPVCTDLCLEPTVDEQSSSDLRGAGQFAPTLNCKPSPHRLGFQDTCRSIFNKKRDTTHRCSPPSGARSPTAGV